MYKNGSSLTGDYVGEHQQLTGLPFRPNATSYSSLPQGQRGLTRSPSRLGTAGMTPSEQISNTTLNILYGVRRSDPLLPLLSPCFVAFCLCPLCPHPWVPHRVLFPLAAMLWGPFLRAFLGSVPSWPPIFCQLTFLQFVWCGFDLGRAFLPSFALGLIFLLPFVRSLSRFVVWSF